MTEDIFVRFARKYFEEAKNDLERARRALGYNDYPQAVFYAQQALEKSVKAMLEVKHRIVHNHGPELIAVFYDIFGNEWKEEYNDIVRALEFLQEYYTRARYPFLLQGVVYGPSDIISREIAVKGVKYAEKTIKIVEEFLRERIG